MKLTTYLVIAGAVTILFGLEFPFQASRSGSTPYPRIRIT